MPLNSVQKVIVSLYSTTDLSHGPVLGPAQALYFALPLVRYKAAQAKEVVQVM
jgi:hypothetical protein